MQAIAYHRYGLPDVLGLEDVAPPTINDDEVLVRVRAASVNSWDWELLQGTPWVNRIGGVLSPRYPILGADIAGTVEAVGRQVRRFQPGDEVFGDLCRSGWGGFAEYTAAHETALAPKPANLTFEQAAAVPQDGMACAQSRWGRRARGVATRFTWAATSSRTPHHRDCVPVAMPLVAQCWLLKRPE
jgi:NADPH:quinone reductase-like Zn-dependent oxidoreductase